MAQLVPDGDVDLPRQLVLGRRRAVARFVATQDARVSFDAIEGSMAGTDGDIFDAIEDLTSCSFASVDANGDPVDADDLNVFKGKYTLHDGNMLLKEKIRNEHKKAPEDYWRNAKTEGRKLASEDPATPITTRLKLGGTGKVTNGTYTIIVPTDGTLTVEVSAGTMKLT